jgi:hypothetical protein
MGKRIVLVVILVVGALLAYNYVTLGRLTLVPSATLSEEEKELDGLETRVREAVRQYAQAGRAAAIGGVDTTGDAEQARLEIERVEKRVKELQKKASETAKVKVREVQEAIQEAKRSIGIK